MIPNSIQKSISAIILSGVFLNACNAQNNDSIPQTQKVENKTNTSTFTKQAYRIEKVAILNEPWAMAQLVDGRLLVTERKGILKLFDPSTKQVIDILGVPKVVYGGQGGLGDIALHPDFEKNKLIYLSYAEASQGGYGAVVVQGELDLSVKNPSIQNIKRIWEQVPKVSGQGHYAHRILFDRAGKLWISSGERQKFDPAQDMQSNLGKILRLNDDGTPAEGNPFTNQGEIAKQIWSLGHRNPLGIAFDGEDKLWSVEMGPKGGDELNLIVRSENYGYPFVSNGDHYWGKSIPDHDTRPEFKAPEISWTPVISPSSLVFYQNELFPNWKGKALIGGLSSKAIVVVDTEHKPVVEVQRLAMKNRIRELEVAHNGRVWVLEDGENAGLLRLLPE